MKQSTNNAIPAKPTLPSVVPECPNDPDGVIDADGWCSVHGWDCNEYASYKLEAMVQPHYSYETNLDDQESSHYE